jgi:putative acetyltransferase
MKIQVREETRGDMPAVRAVNRVAFGRIQEVDLVDRLRKTCRELLSLVAIAEMGVVGHILFTPVEIFGPAGSIKGAGLAPVAVVPEFQKRGVGTALIRAGIKKLKQKGCPFIVVLGHPGYYPRFGFVPGRTQGIRCEWEIPQEAFLILLLDPMARWDIQGTARYCPKFSEPIWHLDKGENFLGTLFKIFTF